MEEKYSFSDIKAIIGLGNPGRKYERTRHNIGFRVVEAFAEQYGITWSDSDVMQHAVLAGPNGAVHLIKPLTFMNLSGKVIPFLLKKGIKGENILVVHDELEKAFGKLAIRFGGSARGHNGLRSIESVIGKEYWRLRFGIGRPDDKSQVSNYVLSPFSKEEEDQIEVLIEEAVHLLQMD